MSGRITGPVVGGAQGDPVAPRANSFLNASSQQTGVMPPLPFPLERVDAPNSCFKPHDTLESMREMERALEAFGDNATDMSVTAANRQLKQSMLEFQKAPPAPSAHGAQHPLAGALAGPQPLPKVREERRESSHAINRRKDERRIAKENQAQRLAAGRGVKSSGYGAPGAAYCVGPKARQNQIAARKKLVRLDQPEMVF